MITLYEATFLIKMVENGCLDRDGFLQTSQSAKAQHGTFSSSKWQVGILAPVVQPSAPFLFGSIAENLHCGAIGAPSTPQPILV